MWGWGLFIKLYNYLTYNFLLYIFLYNTTIFSTFAIQKKTTT